MSALDIFANMSAYGLAGMVNSNIPASLSSPGALFLTHVRDTLLESIQHELYNEDDEDDLSRAIDVVRHEMTHEIADGSVPIYTHALWSTFVDLGAYNQDTSSLYDTPGEDMTERAKYALYLIAECLIDSLLDTIENGDI